MPPFLFKRARVSDSGRTRGQKGAAAVRHHSPDRRTSEGETLQRRNKKIKSDQSIEEQKKGEDKRRCWHHVGIRGGAPAVTGCSGSGSR